MEISDTITIEVPREAAERLAVIWERGSDTELGQLVRAVRDTFNGGDGYLHTLNEALGREH